LVADPTILRFNHYNVNKKCLEWARDFYKNNKISLDGFDYGMKRYKNIFV